MIVKGTHTPVARVFQLEYYGRHDMPMGVEFELKGGKVYSEEIVIETLDTYLIVSSCQNPYSGFHRHDPLKEQECECESWKFVVPWRVKISSSKIRFKVTISAYVFDLDIPLKISINFEPT